MSKNSWAPPDNLQPQKILVVAYTEHFFGEQYGQFIPLLDEWALDLECIFSTDLSLMEQADALWFHGPSIRELPKKVTGQKWILMCMESELNYPYLSDDRVMALFDMHMTYQLDSDVPTLYPNWHQYGSFLESPLSLEFKNRQPAPVLYAASNPVSVRDEYVEELMQHIPVDSIGRCLNNRSIEGFSSGTGWANDGFKSLLSVIRHYKFYLAFENSRTLDYVTERVFMALVAGSVPVYLGAENVREFMPSDDSIICADAFKSAQDLAQYLHYLDQDNAAYQCHLSWKMEGYSSHFKQLVDVSSIEPLTRMFIKLAHNCGHECACGGRMR